MSTMTWSGSATSTLSGSGTLAVLAQPVSVRRISATEFRISVPVVGAVVTTVVEYRLKKNGGNTWSVQGCYVVDMTNAVADVQLSDAGDTSVWEYARLIGVADAAQGSFDYAGCGHGNETLLTLSMLLDGVEVSASSTGAGFAGASLVVYQTSNMLLPKNANGSANGVTVCGSSTLRHTFDQAGWLCEHTHVMNGGYQGFSTYAAMLPTSFTNVNRIQLGALSVKTPSGSEATIDFGTQAATYTAWHTSAHRYRITLTLPSGGPLTSGSWANAGPDKMFFLDRAQYGKCYVNDWGSTYALRANLGSTAHSQRYTVSWV